jgi:hypothetical protein
MCDVVQPDDVTVGLTKLRLGPGDTLLVSVPETWCPDDIEAFEGWFKQCHGVALRGVHIVMISDVMRVYVRDGRVGATAQ